MLPLIARFRVTLGFIVGTMCFALARPSWPTIVAGALIAVPGEMLRLWAAGHIEKGREITRSGPYRFVRHPLYLGWLLGFWAVPVMTGSHLLFAIVTTVYILAAIRWEERDLMRAHPEYEE